jgi:hypothetical protein
LFETACRHFAGSLICLSFLFSLSGCATLPSEPATASGGCSVHLYRNKTSFKAISFDFDLPVAYIDDSPVGKLGVEQTHCINLRPGHYRVAVKKPGLFRTTLLADMPLEVAEGKTVFVRYALEYGGLQGMGSTAYEVANSSLRQVSEQSWRERQ